MRMPVRRALVAATVTALALPSAASASCLPNCHDAVYQGAYDAAASVSCLTICIEEVYARMDRLLGDSDRSGMLCAYAKLSGSPPPGWTGDPTSGPPYIWVQTAAWGDANMGQYDLHLCIPSCDVDSSVMPEVPDLSGGPSLTAVQDAAACAARLLP